MDLLTAALHSPFIWGLLLGLLIAGFLWKAGFTAHRHATRETKRVQTEMKELQGHLSTQLKINAIGNESMQNELDFLKRQNEALRVTIATLQQKPGRAEQRLLQVYEVAIRAMREQAPGFAAAWEKALRQGEAEVAEAESGFTKLVRRVLPGLGNSTPPPTTVIVNEDSSNKS